MVNKSIFLIFCTYILPLLIGFLIIFGCIVYDTNQDQIAIDQGYRAGQLHISFDANPYVDNYSNRKKIWLDGWLNAKQDKYQGNLKE